jgi:hypothetical protein
MFNAEIPSRAELPSTAKLVKSTVAAAAAAVVVLATVVLPAEYAIDPTGIGRALQLTQMGEIKKQLATEAEQDRLRDRQQAPTPSATPATPERKSSLLSLMAGLVVSPAHAHPGGHDDDASDEISPSTAQPPPPASSQASPSIAQQAPAGAKSDEVVFTLKPGEGVEYKMTMKKGALVQFSWRADGDVNYDMHGTQAGGKESSYKKGRAVAADAGTLTAAYDGKHGWFWRNRTSRDVTVTLKVNGAYADLKRMN